MRSNSGSGKSTNGLLDPTMKEHEAARRDDRHHPADGATEQNRATKQDGPAKVGPAD